MFKIFFCYSLKCGAKATLDFHGIFSSFSDCGIRPFTRQPRSSYQNTYYGESLNRSPKIMYGLPTKQGQYPWQVSLELLHPSFGFIGHWCGGVLIDKGMTSFSCFDWPYLPLFSHFLHFSTFILFRLDYFRSPLCS
jgi:hypothetical protein